MGVRFAVVGWSVVVLTMALSESVAAQQAPSSVTPTPARASSRSATEIHTRGHYPDDLLVEPVDDDATPSTSMRAPIPIYGGQGSPNLAPDPGKPPEIPEWLRRLHLPRWIGDLFVAFGWGALALVVALIVALVLGVVYLLFRLRPAVPQDGAASSGRRVKRPAEDEVAADDPLLAVPTETHDELARSGRYREAVHALLVAALFSTGWAPEGRGRGMTAREIALGYTRPTPPREPLLALLALVERVWFGGREATEATYAEALDAYRAFVPDGARTA